MKMKNKNFGCVAMKRSGAEKVYKHTQNMTLSEELSYWQQQIEKLRRRQAIATYSQARYYGLQGQVKLAVASQITTLKQALPPAVAKLTDLDPKYREMAKTDADFDGVRSDGCSAVPEG
ncbi:MAG: hypothetical protein LH660_15045 [Phormidesmis sp. CAN_BIN36]|nr:hypothetical protein [Phormidesmis sp. CAN_BIN36]